MKRIAGFTLIVLLVLPVQVEAQFSIFRKRSSADRATRDLEKRQRDAGEQNAFNAVQPMGRGSDTRRDDHLWSSETAYTAINRTGNISITTPSRLGIHQKTEIQSMLGAFYFVPNILVKHRWHTGKQLWWATRHGVYFPSNGLTWAQKRGFSSVIDTTISVSQVIAIRNELIVSKPVGNKLSCVPGQPFLIITAGLALDYSSTLSGHNVKPIDEHILGARSTALIGDGLLIIARIRADAQLTEDMIVEGGFRFLTGENNISDVIEHHAALNYRLTNNITVSPGYIVSFGNLGNSNPQLYPFFDLTWYFGQKPRRHISLFGRN